MGGYDDLFLAGFNSKVALHSFLVPSGPMLLLWMPELILPNHAYAVRNEGIVI